MEISGTSSKWKRSHMGTHHQAGQSSSKVHNFCAFLSSFVWCQIQICNVGFSMWAEFDYLEHFLVNFPIWAMGLSACPSGNIRFSGQGLTSEVIPDSRVKLRLRNFPAKFSYPFYWNKCSFDQTFVYSDSIL